MTLICALRFADFLRLCLSLNRPSPTPRSRPASALTLRPFRFPELSRATSKLAQSLVDRYNLTRDRSIFLFRFSCFASPGVTNMTARMKNVAVRFDVRTFEGAIRGFIFSSKKKKFHNCATEVLYLCNNSSTRALLEFTSRAYLWPQQSWALQFVELANFLILYGKPTAVGV